MSTGFPTRPLTIVHAVYSMEMGGAEMLVAQLCRTQKRNGHNVSVCCYSMLGALGEMLIAEGIAVHVLGTGPVPLTMFRYWQHFRRVRPDVVHTHNPAPTIQAALGARLAGARCIIATRHSLVERPYNTGGEIKFNLLARAIDYVAGICDITCDNLRGTPLAQQHKIVRVYNGASAVPEAAPEPKQPGRFVLLFVGRLAAIKDLPTLLHAVALALPFCPGLELWIVGDGVVRTALEALADGLGLKNTVRFFGQQMDTARYFRAADVFAMSSTSEGLPMSLVQALSIGLPAITTDVGGMREVLDLTGSGIYTPVGDAEAMARSILQLASDEAMRERFRERALRGYANHFTLEQMDAEYMRLYCNARPLRSRGASTLVTAETQERSATVEVAR